MVYSSIIFLLLLLPLVLLAYYVVPHSKKNIVALLASLLFYFWGAPKFFMLLIPLLIVNFYIVQKISTSTERLLQKKLLWLSLSINLGVLAYFKYANFFVENVNEFLSLFGVQSFSWVEVMLPIGISFFTFQSITYSLDVYWGKHKPLKRVWDYLLYILLFPQLIAGPIIRFNTIADELNDRKHNFYPDFQLNGLYIFVLGLAKKVLIANQIGEQVDLIFADAAALDSGMLWIGIVAYSMQIYFDFAGYSDMAIGLGKMLGFNFPENFKNPYTATSITDFWRKWHITLGAFMRDYLYIPLGGNRSSFFFSNHINLVVVFLLSGLWHGASWNFVIWGAWHGTFLLLERLFLSRILERIPQFFQLVYSYFIVLIGWVFFRTETLSDASTYLQRMFLWTGEQENSLQLDFKFYVFLGLALLFSYFTLFRFGKKAELFVYSEATTWPRHIVLFSGALVLTILSISYVASSDFNPFIYFRF